EEKQHATDYVGPNSIGYVFAVAQSNLLLWMVREKVEIVAVSNQNWERNEHLRRELRIVGRTWAVPRHVVSFGAHVPGPVAARLREVLVGMDEEPEGRRVLEQLERTDRFDEFPQDPEAGLKGVKDLMSFVRRELGAL
ncbi:MAG: PhnD/SsuA/transferrin family substrate-binding protein, partial [Deltaproteobacteria bacterium]|nr:PhnD/SsuA/transferrin family substrate-binding protein [Deltaproteobacteria bacterium]